MTCINMATCMSDGWENVKTDFIGNSGDGAAQSQLANLPVILALSSQLLISIALYDTTMIFRDCGFEMRFITTFTLAHPSVNKTEQNIKMPQKQKHFLIFDIHVRTTKVKDHVAIFNHKKKI